MSSERDDREIFAELIAAKVAYPLREELVKISTEARHTRDEVDRIGAFFGPGPESLPSQVADLQTVKLHLLARVIKLEDTSNKKQTAHVTGIWMAVVAAIGALATVLASVWKAGQ